MTEIQKKAPVKAIAKAEIAAKPVKTALAKHVPAKVPLNNCCQTSSRSSCSDNL